MDLNQITLTVRDYDEAIVFYTKLGFVQIVHTDHGYARFETDGGQTLSVHTDPEATPAGTIIYFEVPDVAARIAVLKSHGIMCTSEPEDKPWLWTEAQLNDPSGNEIRFYHAGSTRRFPPWRMDGRKE